MRRLGDRGGLLRSECAAGGDAQVVARGVAEPEFQRAPALRGRAEGLSVAIHPIPPTCPGIVCEHSQMIRTPVLGLSAAVAAMALAWTATPAVADTGCPTASSSYGGGAGTAGSPYEISVPGHLQRLKDTAADHSKYFVLTQDIAMGGCTWSSPIANGSSTFTGTLDGAGHVISGLTVAVTSASIDYVGLIGYLGAGGVVEDLGFSGDVSLVKAPGTSNYASVGGLVGFMFTPTQVSNSFATGNVTVDITTSDNSPQVFAGGLVGVSQGPVSNSYARGAVSARLVSTAGGASRVRVEAGGLIGLLNTNTVSYSYSTGAATAVGTAASTTLRAGGLTGAREVAPVATSLYWDTTTSGLSSGTGFGSTTGMTGATTAQMKASSTFTGGGWSLSEGFTPSSTWGMCSQVNGGYPFLTAFHSSNPCVGGAASNSQIPPVWYQSIGRSGAEEQCPSGWNPSWAEWMNGGRGGFVCNREIYWNVNTNDWATRKLLLR